MTDIVPEVLDLLVCPNCKAPLAWDYEASELVCTGECRYAYPVRRGIPVLLVLISLVGGSIGGPYFGKIDEVSTNDQSTFLPSSAEATQVQQRLADFTGGDTIPAVVVVTGDGALTNDQLASIADLATTISGVEGVGEGVGVEAAALHGQRMVHDELHRHHGVHLGRVAALLGNRIA